MDFKLLRSFKIAAELENGDDLDPAYQKLLGEVERLKRSLEATVL